MRPVELRLESVVCRHGPTVVVDRVDLSVAPGEHVALIGGNGAGKTTLLRAVLGLHPDVDGRITLDGQEATTRADWHARRRRVAWVPQRQATGGFPMPVGELLASGGSPLAVRAAAERLGVWNMRDRPVRTLSGGQLQRVFLARALASLAGEAGMLLADEPTASLDFAGQAAVAEVLAGLAATVLVVSHDRAVAARCDRTVEMAGGQLREEHP